MFGGSVTVPVNIETLEQQRRRDNDENFNNSDNYDNYRNIIVMIAISMTIVTRT